MLFGVAIVDVGVTHVDGLYVEAEDKTTKGKRKRKEKKMEKVTKSRAAPPTYFISLSSFSFSTISSFV